MQVNAIFNVVNVGCLASIHLLVKLSFLSRAAEENVPYPQRGQICVAIRWQGDYTSSR